MEQWVARGAEERPSVEARASPVGALAVAAAGAVARALPPSSQQLGRDGPFSGPRMSAGWREPAHWRTMQARWVRRGVPVEMATGVKAIPFHVAPSPRMDREQWKERKEERNRLLENGAFVAAPVQDASELMRRGAMICPAFLVAKKGKTNRWRLVIDQRP
eukprot:SAG11_NODE_9263_length_927_cov_3.640097_2_plen_160_part_01